jgi:hypothetical protein
MPMTGETRHEAACAQMFAALGAVVLPLIVALLAERFNRAAPTSRSASRSVIACESPLPLQPPFGFRSCCS